MHSICHGYIMDEIMNAKVQISPSVPPCKMFGLYEIHDPQLAIQPAIPAQQTKTRISTT